MNNDSTQKDLAPADSVETTGLRIDLGGRTVTYERDEDLSVTLHKGGMVTGSDGSYVLIRLGEDSEDGDAVVVEPSTGGRLSAITVLGEAMTVLREVREVLQDRDRPKGV